MVGEGRWRMLLRPRDQRPASCWTFCRVQDESPGQSQIWIPNFHRTESRCGIIVEKSSWGAGTWQCLREQFLLVSHCLSLLQFPDQGRKQHFTIHCSDHFHPPVRTTVLGIYLGLAVGGHVFSASHTVTQETIGNTSSISWKESGAYMWMAHHTESIVYTAVLKTW